MNRDTQQLAVKIEALLRAQLTAHEQMLALVEQQRAALRRGDADALTALCRRQNEQVQRLSELEKQRLEAVAALTKQLAPQAAEPMKLLELAQQLPEPVRSTLLVLRQQVRDRMERLAQQTSVARRAAESLTKHVAGLVRTIAHVSSGGPAYTMTGRANATAPRLSALNLTA